MKNYVIGATFLVVVGIAAFFLFRSHGGPVPVTICSDEVRSREQTVKSSLSTAAKNLEEVKVALEGEGSNKYLDQLTKISPTDLLALKTCDTQCKLLELCLTRNKTGSVETTCPTEYKDYKARVEASLQLVARIEQYEKETQEAVADAQEVKRTAVLLADAQAGTGATGAREAVLRQNLAAQKQMLVTRVRKIDTIAEKVLTHR
jgi:hypothetical protein